MDIHSIINQTANKVSWSQKTLQQTAKDLVNKNYLPKQFGEFVMKDPQIWRSSMWNFMHETFNDFQCPHCSITIRAPKEWVKQHIKTHFKTDSKKENEMQIAKVNPYKIR